MRDSFSGVEDLFSNSLVLCKPVDGEPLYVYLSIVEKVIRWVLIREEKKQQKPIYFVSKALQGV